MNDELFQTSTQCVEHFAQLDNERQACVTALASREAQVDGQQELRVQFRHRSLGVRDELDEFARAVTGLAFGDVRRDGNRGTSHLRDQPEALFARSDRLVALLDAADSGKLSLADFDPARLRIFEAYPNAAIRDRAQPMLAKLKLGKRQDVVDAYRGVLSAGGDISRGRQVFQRTCAACHRLEGVGHEIGPNLASLNTKVSDANPFQKDYSWHRGAGQLAER